VQADQDARALRAQLASLQEDLRLAKAADRVTLNLEKKDTKKSKQLSIDVNNELAENFSFARKEKPHDDSQSSFWSRKAVEQGDAEAQSNKRDTINYSNGVNKDDRQDEFWYPKSTDK